jgi:hypothetical protein
MPYGLEGDRDKDPKLEGWMEKCVASVKAKSKMKDVGRAVAICKAQLKKMKYDTKKASIYMDLFVIEHVDEPWTADENFRVPSDVDKFGEN